MPPWMPDWKRMMAEAPEISLPGREGYLYVVADSHLGDARAPVGEFFQMLGALPQARMVLFLGDLFQVWLGLPKFWDEGERTILKGFQRLRDSGVAIVFVVGNREALLPKTPEKAARVGLPFDHVVHGACTLRWGDARLGFTHGDVINREDTAHLKWRRFMRGPIFAAMFHAMPRPLARMVSAWIERTAAGTNREIKIQFPESEVRAFAETALDGLDGFFVGHFHRDWLLELPGKGGPFRIAPDWHSKKALLRIGADGACARLVFSGEKGLRQQEVGS